MRPWLLLSPFCPLCKARALPNAEGETLMPPPANQTRPPHAQQRAPDGAVSAVDDEETAELLTAAAAAIGAAREASAVAASPLLQQAVSAIGAARTASAGAGTGAHMPTTTVRTTLQAPDLPWSLRANQRAVGPLQRAATGDSGCAHIGAFDSLPGVAGVIAIAGGGEALRRSQLAGQRLPRRSAAGSMHHGWDHYSR